MNQTSHYLVESSEAGSLLSFLRKRLPATISGKKIKQGIDQGLCWVNGKRETFSTHPLRFRDRVRLCSTFFSTFLESRSPLCHVHYEDESLLILNKPSGLVCSERFLLRHYPCLPPSFCLVHRLDKETSGLWLVAKTKIAYQSLYEQFAKRKVEKEYLALVEGIPAETSGHIASYLGVKTRYQGQTLYHSVPAKERWQGSLCAQGKWAETSWNLLLKPCHDTNRNRNRVSLLQCFPKTGRTHQIRVHLKEIGHPILGDLLYGSSLETPLEASRNSALTISRCLLHARALSFTHPTTGDPTTRGRVRFDLPVPDDFEKAIRLLGLS